MTDKPRAGRTREEIALAEIGRTAISPRLATLLVSLFVVTIAGVPTLEWLTDREPRPRALGITQALPSARVAFTQIEGSPWKKLLAGNAELLRRIKDYEEALTHKSVPSRALIGRTQFLLLRALGQGSETVYTGRDGWLFFRDDVDHVTGAGFLEPQRLAARRRAEGVEPDPRRAIVAFRDALARRGIALVVIPVPAKPAIHPAYLSSRFVWDGGPAENPSYAVLVTQLRAAGVLVVDAQETLRSALEFSGLPQYLASDTHWNPAGMEAVARQTGRFVSWQAAFEQPRRRYAQTPIEVLGRGDLAALLRLPQGQTWIRPELVALRQVRDARRGDPWRPSRSAEILLLGDSFSNIYSLAEMGWGESAGFAAQISFHAERPLDVIIQNDNGACATREALVARQGRGDDPLLGKKVVIWQFAARELSQGDWKALALR